MIEVLIPKMMVWKLYLLSNMAFLGIHVKFCGCTRKKPNIRDLGSELVHPKMDPTEIDMGLTKLFGEGQTEHGTINS